MRHLLILLSFCLLIVSCGHTSPQDKVLLARADSLMEAHPDSALTLLRHITDSKHLSSPDHALYALLMSQALEKCYIVVKSDSLIRIATNYYKTRNLVRAGYAWFYLSRCEGNRGNAQGQANALLKAQEVASKVGNLKLLGFIYGEKANEYDMQQQCDSAFYYYRLSHSFLKKAGDRRNSVATLIDIGIENFSINRYDSALYYYKIAETEALLLGNPLLIAAIHSSMASVYNSQKQYSKAIHYYQLSLHTSDNYDFSKWIGIAETYLLTNKLDSARFYLEKCDNPRNIAPKYYQLWQELYEKEGDIPKALYYAKKVYTVLDSLNKRSLTVNFADWEKRYNYQRFSAENSKLAASNQQKMNFVLMLLLALFALIIFFLLFFLYKKKEELILQQKIANQEKERANLMEQQHQLKEMLRKKIDIFKQTALSLSKASMQQQNTTNDTDYARQLEEALSNIDAYHNYISSRLQTQFHCLSRKEIHIALLILAGFTSSQIADLLNTSENTVNVNRSAIRKKLKIEGKSDLTDFLAHF